MTIVDEYRWIDIAEFIADAIWTGLYYLVEFKLSVSFYILLPFMVNEGSRWQQERRSIRCSSFATMQTVFPRVPLRNWSEFDRTFSTIRLNRAFIV